jgi:type III secretion protein C
MRAIHIPHALRRCGAVALTVAIAAIASCASTSVSAQGSPEPSTAAPWPESPFTVMNTGQSLEKVLTNFTRTFGLNLRLDESLPDDVPPAQGRIAAATPTEFLNQIGSTHGLMWYQSSGTLHIARASSRTTRVLPTKGLSSQSLRRVLTGMGLVETKFGWSEIEERGAVMVSGPATYVERIATAIDALPEPRPEQQIQVYRLKYAAVDDRVISYREKQITTPGVASVLRNLVAGNSGGGTSSELVELAAPLRPAATTTTRDGAPDTEPAEAKAPADKPGSRNTRTPRAVIQADSRLNAIIVKDKPESAPIYRALIDLLDVPSTLVEIEAMIVDVNSSNMSDLGVDWSGSSGKFAASISGGAAFSLAGAAAAGASNFIAARITAMETKGSAKVVSRPSILTQDNMGALIDLADTFYIQSTGERVAQVTPVTVGVTLRVTPRIVGDAATRAVQLVVDIEDGGIQEVRVGGLPSVRRSTISTQAMVGETQSLVIGGLNSEQNLRSRDGVPGLSDVPVAGALFNKTTQMVEKRQRLFIITPRIVAQPVALVPQSAPAAPKPRAVDTAVHDASVSTGETQ